MQIKEIAVTKRVNLANGQSIDISVTGSMSEGDASEDTAKLMLSKVLNSGVVNILQKEILKPLRKYKVN